MYLNYRAIARMLFAFLILHGIALVPSAIVGIIYSEKNMAILFSTLFLTEVLVGTILFRFTKQEQKPFRIRDGFLVVSLGWILACLLGSLPFYFSGFFDGFIDSFFESTSGFTTTGATILQDIEILPKALLFWRSFSSWVGGFCILFVPIALLPSLGIEGQIISKAELSGSALNIVLPKLSDVTKWLTIVFLGLTLLETLFLCFGGLSIFDALTHSFATLSTGGFSNYNDNIGHFQSGYVFIIISLFMLISGINFNLYYIFFTHKKKKTVHDDEFIFYLFMIVSAIFLIAIFLKASGIWNTFDGGILTIIFQVISMTTTTGFFVIDYDTFWPIFPKLILLALMFVGGCSASTSGGIKSMRALVLLKMLRRGVLIRLHPNAVIDLKANKKRLPIDTLQSISSFIFMWFALAIASSLIVSLSGLDATTSISAVLSCMSNVGHGLSGIGPSLDFSLFSEPLKVFLAFVMIVGRLEFIAIFALFSRHFWNPNF